MKVIILNDGPDQLEKCFEQDQKRTKSMGVSSFTDSEKGFDAFATQEYDLALIGKRENQAELAKQLKKLRPEFDSVYLSYQESSQKRGIYARTFGQFDLFVNGKSLHFNRAKSKEVIAYLIDRRGSGVTKREIASVIFEDSLYSKNIQDYMGKIMRDLENTLEAEGVRDLLVKGFNYYALDPEKLRCDYYEYMNSKDKTAVEVPFCGEYMSQYSWAEDTIASLYYGNEDWDE